MSIVKSFSVYDKNGEAGDMFYIQHGTNNFTIIDCCLNDDKKDYIVNEIIEKSKGKNIIRVISTHPDEDHICGLEFLDKKIGISNFYCVKNSAIKKEQSDSFIYYCKIRDKKNTYYIEKGIRRKWLNSSDETDLQDNGSSGISFLWPDTTNLDYIDALQNAADGISFNNISPIFTYSLNNGVKMMWMGDIEHDFLEKIKCNINWGEVDILFAPHHGRESGKVPVDILKKLNPKVIIVGEAPAKHLDYYSGYNTITQNSAKDITFKCEKGKVHIYVSSADYSVNYLKNEKYKSDSIGYYLGSFDTKEQ